MLNEDKKIVYYVQGERAPVEEFIHSLDRRTRQKFFAKIELLKTFWNCLSQPHAKYVGNGLFELRFSGIESEIRVIYFFFHQNSVVLTHGFLKKTQKLPPAEKRLALMRKQTFIEAHS